MSLLYSVICLAICAIAVARLNSLSNESAYVKRAVLVLIAVGAFGGVLRPLAPELISGVSDVMFASGILTSMVVRYYKPEWYDDRRPPTGDTLIERLLDKVR
jgi:hypothetical protein